MIENDLPDDVFKIFFRQLVSEKTQNNDSGNEKLNYLIIDLFKAMFKISARS